METEGEADSNLNKSSYTSPEEAALRAVPDHLKESSTKRSEEMLSNQMLNGIPEVDLGIEAKIKNIEATEEAKLKLLWEKQNKKDGSSQFVPTNMAVNFVQHNRCNLADNEEPYPSLSDYHDYEPKLEFDDCELHQSPDAVAQTAELIQIESNGINSPVPDFTDDNFEEELADPSEENLDSFMYSPSYPEVDDSPTNKFSEIAKYKIVDVKGDDSVAYKAFERKYKKNLKALFLVHPTNFLKIVSQIFRPLISAKFGKKLNYIHTLKELNEHISLEKLDIPEEVI
ncbi:Hep 59 and/or CRAL TRIO 2 domain containing protein, partial [Asbolus verrucosus]